MRENYCNESCNESTLCKGAPVLVRLFPKDQVHRITYRRSVVTAAGPAHRGGRVQRINCNLLIGKYSAVIESDLRTFLHRTRTYEFVYIFSASLI